MISQQVALSDMQTLGHSFAQSLIEHAEYTQMKLLFLDFVLMITCAGVM